MRLFNLLRSLWRALPLSPIWRQRIKRTLLTGPWARLGQAPALDLPAWNGDWQGLLAPLAEPADRVLVIDWQPPTPDRDSGSVRLRALLELMREMGFQVELIADRPPPEPRYVEDLLRLKIQTFVGQDAALKRLAACGHRYSHIWILRPEMMELYLAPVRAHAPQALVIYDTVDLHWVRFGRSIPYAADPEAMRRQAEHYRRLELANARAADRVVAITDEERALLLTEDPGLAVFVLPNIHAVTEEVPPWEARRDLLFIGGFQHAPNVDAVHYFAAEILPLIRAELPEVRLIIVGSQMPDSIRALGSSAIEPVGYVPEVRPSLDQARVFVAPLRQGAGMKGKIGQSLGFGLPVVTTAIGAEGMGLVHEETALIADDPAAFAQAVVRLYRDRALWQRLSQSGRELVRARYTQSVVSQRLRAILAGGERTQTARSGAEEGPSVRPVEDAAPIAIPVLPQIEGAASDRAQPHPAHHDPAIPPAERRVLILGIYLADAPNHALAISRELLAARDWQVDLRWAAIGGQEDRVRDAHPKAPASTVACTSEPPALALDELTWLRLSEPQSKFALLNRLLETVEGGAERYRYLLAVDDDIELPPGFLDHFLAIQERCGFTLAQPARTADSFIDHHFVMQLQEVEARKTRFVEIGPVFALRHEGFAVILPFDERAPMGWGLDFVWPLLLEREGLSLGIIDAVAVRHALRPPVSTYDYAETQAAMQRFLAGRPHLGLLDACVSLAIYPSSGTGEMPAPQTAGFQEAASARAGARAQRNDPGAAKGPKSPPTPWLSAILCTRNRAQLLARALAGLCAQTLDPERFEVILIDDGSTDETAQVAEHFAPWLNLRYSRQPHAGLAAAKNHGVCLARAPIVVFLDDDDVLDSRALEEHLAAHRREPDLALAVLGWTGLGGKAARSPLMRYVTEVGCQLFYYPALKDVQLLDFSFFWGGRSSCKRELLLREGLFDPQFRFGAEDIELAFRLRRAGLRVRYHAAAKGYMIRDLSVDDIARRSVLQGRSNWAFYRKHPQPEVWDWAQLAGIEAEWMRIAEHYPRLLKTARDLDRWARARVEQDLPLDPLGTSLLHCAYAALLRASRIKGTIEGMHEGADRLRRDFAR
ncbi:glycosyltransferase [Caldichromatium japonicum]|uniref:Glycosyltransferase n=1 Tax=Caldichromatium japonicum TaxID=2699430 RepID=A0A6G7VFI7_9GAMM|nr:glycosyltransferase [Caldichromatium japonicum]QIK38843.1 glycosyltransferase [Caldichromatium japonicum]